ncbi:unnamed protein product [Mytilus edulis]|uniref:DDE Tnp4 domain-containing protein n=1 Tax=Mytilus edulis TaxID=6550 RepID=A0A8S3QMY9_MYTED|nr:unnamed protein product [Mytilus edulis]
METQDHVHVVMLLQSITQIQNLNDQAMMLLLRERRRRIRRTFRRRRSFWIRPWLATDRRLQFGHYDQLMNELRIEDEPSFFNFLRMPPVMFDELPYRVDIHLATGEKYSTLEYDFRVARNSISKFLPEVCRAIVDEYKDEVISCPTDQNDWRAIADEFQKRWNVPHACGALDGEHVAIRCPPKTGSLYHNYKDAQIYNASELKECLEDGTIGFPEPDPLPNDDQNMPYFLLGDDAFGLRTYLMKPFSIRGMSKEQAITNYRISRGRRVVENAFGILAQRWQIFLSTMGQVPDTVSVIIETCVCLHNLMRMRYPNLQNVQLDMEDDLHNLVPGLWRANANMHEVNSVVGPNRDTVAAKKQREYLKLYFNSPAGSVPWQERMVTSQ